MDNSNNFRGIRITQTPAAHMVEIADPDNQDSYIAIPCVTDYRITAQANGDTELSLKISLKSCQAKNIEIGTKDFARQAREIYLADGYIR